MPRKTLVRYNAKRESSKSSRKGKKVRPPSDNDKLKRRREEDEFSISSFSTNTSVGESNHSYDLRSKSAEARVEEDRQINAKVAANLAEMAALMFKGAKEIDNLDAEEKHPESTSEQKTDKARNENDLSEKVNVSRTTGGTCQDDLVKETDPQPKKTANIDTEENSQSTKLNRTQENNGSQDKSKLATKQFKNAGIGLLQNVENIQKEIALVEEKSMNKNRQDSLVSSKHGRKAQISDIVAHLNKNKAEEEATKKAGKSITDQKFQLSLDWQLQSEVKYEDLARQVVEEESEILRLINRNQTARAAQMMCADMKRRNAALRRQTTSGFRNLSKEAEEARREGEVMELDKLGNFISFYFFHGFFLACVAVFFELIREALPEERLKKICTLYYQGVFFRTEYRKTYWAFVEKAGLALGEYNPAALGHYCRDSLDKTVENTMFADKMFRKTCQAAMKNDGKTIAEVEKSAVGHILTSVTLARELEQDPEFVKDLQGLSSSENSDMEDQDCKNDCADSRAFPNTPAPEKIVNQDSKEKRVGFLNLMNASELPSERKQPPFSSTPKVPTGENELKSRTPTMNEIVSDRPIPTPRKTNQSEIDKTLNDPSIVNCSKSPPPEPKEMGESKLLDSLFTGMKVQSDQGEEEAVLNDPSMWRPDEESVNSYFKRQQAVINDFKERIRNQKTEQIKENRSTLEQRLKNNSTKHKTDLKSIPKSSLPSLVKTVAKDCSSKPVVVERVKEFYEQNPYIRNIRYLALQLRKQTQPPPLWENFEQDDPEMYYQTFASYGISTVGQFYDELRRAKIPEECWPNAFGALQQIIGVHPIQFGERGCEILKQWLDDKKKVDEFGLNQDTGNPFRKVSVEVVSDQNDDTDDIHTEVEGEDKRKVDCSNQQNQGSKNTSKQNQNKKEQSNNDDANRSSKKPTSNPPASSQPPGGPPDESPSSSHDSETSDDDSEPPKKIKKVKKKNKDKLHRERLEKELKAVQEKLKEEQALRREQEEKQKQERLNEVLKNINTQIQELRKEVLNLKRRPEVNKTSPVTTSGLRSETSEGATKKASMTDFFGDSSMPETITKSRNINEQLSRRPHTTEKTFTKNYDEREESSDWSEESEESEEAVEEHGLTLTARVQGNPDQTAKNRYLNRHRQSKKSSREKKSLKYYKDLPLSHRMDRYFAPPLPSQIDWGIKLSRAKRLERDEFPPVRYYKTFFPAEWAEPPVVKELRAGDNERLVRQFKHIFNGKIEDYPVWKKKFRTGVHLIDVKVSTKVEVLQNSLDDKCSELKNLMPRRDSPSWDVSVYCQLLKTLESKFGGAERQAKYYRKKLMDMPKLKSTSFEELDLVYNTTRNCVDILIDRHETSWIESKDFYEKMIKKFPRDFRLAYLESCQRLSLDPMQIWNLFEYLEEQTHTQQRLDRLQGFSSSEEDVKSKSKTINKKSKSSKQVYVTSKQVQVDSNSSSEEIESQNSDQASQSLVAYPMDLVEFIEQEDYAHLDNEIKAFMIQEGNRKKGKFKIPDCPKCKEPHLFVKCEWFNKLSPTQRAEYLASQDRCFNCFSSQHKAKHCPLPPKCKEKKSDGEKCGRRHHTLLHGSEFRFTKDMPSTNS